MYSRKRYNFSLILNKQSNIIKYAQHIKHDTLDDWLGCGEGLKEYLYKIIYPGIITIYYTYDIQIYIQCYKIFI